jgi:mannose-1-phosphate guanylyltransferase
MIHAVIMAGGKGERFWPWSRESTPKQLLPIVGEESMLEQTAARVRPLVGNSRIWVVTNEKQGKAIRRLLPGLSPRHLLLEPAGRNTAPCIALAAAAVAEEDPEGVLLVLPADHVISPRKAFLRTMASCARIARKRDCLITVGIPPRYPATGYGYIRRGREEARDGKTRFFTADEFREKPDRKTARRLVSSGRYYWNAGIFVWSVNSIAAALDAHLPDIAKGAREICRAPRSARGDALRRIYPRLPSISIDYGVMEKHDRVLVVPASFAWDDVGSWDALSAYYPKDPEGNAGRGDFAAVDSAGCLAVSDGPLIGLVGVDRLVVAATRDAVLVCSRDRSQDVKKLVQKLRKNARQRRFL